MRLRQGSSGLTAEQCSLVQRFEPGGTHQPLTEPAGSLALAEGAVALAAGANGGEKRRGGLDTMGFFIAKFVKTASYSDDFT